ncbi:phosphate signaling complex protein PhoU [Rhodopirellula sp. JC740]|uniref:Phosphate-specific transport system accessory protein PhoU n=1 Tax=Rhodopirellula halodulae TaxID=2894198 RepID=A0ABS8NFD4_9BACT|nr:MULTISPECIES: phosphate signaling complex protein PhoU [unclassified Rhodopirellula]MCC9641171.1 phosphate signaling complex protein PhoU [Rhodopirellula sp. JC740]MCC9657579.1 phosphate signaling complex protein PhoU [Rhodopirellula sp. JC737]
MSKHLNRAVLDLRSDLVEQFGVVEQMIELSVRSLVERRPDFAVQVIETDTKVDEKDVRIEEECLKLLALYQPVAIDLRWMVSAVKLNGELERMADLACNIAERSKALDLFPLFSVPSDINQMVTIVLEMVRAALDSFIEQDAEMARDVIARDDEVDRLNVDLIDELQEMMKSETDWVEPAVHCFSATRHLERIADLATNVAEETIYMVSGDIIRHKHHLEERQAR